MGLTPSAIVFLILATGCCFVSGYFTLREIEEVNQKLRRQEQIEYAFMYPRKMKKIRVAYGRFYPHGARAAAFVFLGFTALAARFLR